MKTIGNFPKLITIPTHFFKIIKGKRYISVPKGSSGELEQVILGCFLIPNETIDSNIPIGRFIVRLNDIETLGKHSILLKLVDLIYCSWFKFFSR